MFIFDGDNKRIHIDGTYQAGDVIQFTPNELWSRYVDWVATGTNSRYLPAMEVIGGNSIGGGQYVGTYLFFRNDLGWRGVPPMVDGITVMINGSFFGKDPELPVMENNPGQETDLVINRSTLVTAVSTSGGSTYTLAQIADAVWSRNNRELTNVIESGPTKEEIADAVWNKVLP